MVEVFKTNVQQNEEAITLIQKLIDHFPTYRINFDLSDCDKILRMEGERIFPEEVVGVLNSSNYECVILE